jgi:predicted nucleic acid-binding protein
MVFDTNVYIAALREGLGGAAFDRLQEAGPRTFLASVVSSELRVGVRDEDGLAMVIALDKRFERLGRIVVPTAGSWKDVGDVLAKIAHREPSLRTKVRGLWNDALIAMSARQIGATVVTQNVRDFGLLRRYMRFEMEPVPGLR